MIAPSRRAQAAHSFSVSLSSRPARSGTALVTATAGHRAGRVRPDGASARVAGIDSASRRTLDDLAMTRKDWFKAMQDLLDDLSGTLHGAHAIVVTGQASGWTDNDLSLIRVCLRDSLEFLNAVKEPQDAPFGSIEDLGEIDPGYRPDTLVEYARICSTLAEQAAGLTRSRERFDAEKLGTKIKTLDYLLTRKRPHNYQTKVASTRA